TLAGVCVRYIDFRVAVVREPTGQKERGRIASDVNIDVVLGDERANRGDGAVLDRDPVGQGLEQIGAWGGVHHGDRRLDDLGIELGLIDALGRLAPAGQVLADLILGPLGRRRVAGPGLDRGTDRRLARADQGPCNLVLSRHLSLLGAVPRRIGCRTVLLWFHYT